jgi:hypothetical protein
MLLHDKAPTGEPKASAEHIEGNIYLLLRDGRLFGPFPSTTSARYWAVSQELNGYSTYDLRNPKSG